MELMMLRRFLITAIAAVSTIAVACYGQANIELGDPYDTLTAALGTGGMKIEDQVENNFLFAGLFSVLSIEVTARGQNILALGFPT